MLTTELTTTKIKYAKKINPKTNWPQLRKAQKQNLILSLN